MGKKNRQKKKQSVSYQAKRKKKDMRMLTMITVGLVVLIVGIFGIAHMAADGQQEKINRLAQGQPVLGDPNAPVTLIEFGDFKCPVCKRFEETVFPLLKKEYIDTGKVKMAFLNMQFIGPDSVTAGIAGSRSTVKIRRHSGSFMTRSTGISRTSTPSGPRRSFWCNWPSNTFPASM